LPDSNENIATAIKEGNEKVFGLFVDAEFNNILYFVNQYLKDDMLAKDVAQETFITLWKVRQNINPKSNLRAYTFTIARNKALNLLREKHITSTDTLDKNEITLYTESLSSNHVSEKIDALELEELLEKTYAEMSPKVRESFLLSREQGLTYQEIAKKRGLSAKAVEYHMNTALKLLRKRLKEYLVLFMCLLYNWI
jgi:RNA polymerase sigma-70 factor (ECF subfamily)